MTRPEVTGEPPAVTVAVRIIGVLYGTLVDEIDSVVVVAVAAMAACVATQNEMKIARKRRADETDSEAARVLRERSGEVIRVPCRHDESNL
jgi:uncharacterized membrane protein